MPADALGQYAYLEQVISELEGQQVEQQLLLEEAKLNELRLEVNSLQPRQVAEDEAKWLRSKSLSGWGLLSFGKPDNRRSSVPTLVSKENAEALSKLQSARHRYQTQFSIVSALRYKVSKLQYAQLKKEKVIKLLGFDVLLPTHPQSCTAISSLDSVLEEQVLAIKCNKYLKNALNWASEFDSMLVAWIKGKFLHQGTKSFSTAKQAELSSLCNALSNIIHSLQRAEETVQGSASSIDLSRIETMKNQVGTALDDVFEAKRLLQQLSLLKAEVGDTITAMNNKLEHTKRQVAEEAERKQSAQEQLIQEVSPLVCKALTTYQSEGPVSAGGSVEIGHVTRQE